MSDICRMTYEQAMRAYENDLYNWEHSARRYREARPTAPALCTADRSNQATAAPEPPREQPRNIRQERKEQQAQPARRSGGMTPGDYYHGRCEQPQAGRIATRRDDPADMIVRAGDPFRVRGDELPDMPLCERMAMGAEEAPIAAPNWPVRVKR